jgi:hypothetical protein
VAIAHNAHFSAMLPGFNHNLLDFGNRGWLIVAGYGTREVLAMIMPVIIGEVGNIHTESS